MKKALSILTAACMVLSLAACSGGSGSSSSQAADTSSETSAATTEEAGTSASGTVYTIGICQQQPHEALDSATQGFKDALVEAFGRGWRQV